MKKTSERRDLGAWVSLGRGQTASEDDPAEVWARRAAAARRGDPGSLVSETRARDIAGNATAVCALARARFLEAAAATAAAEGLRRSAWRLGASRAEKLRLTFDAAKEDGAFTRTVFAADAARDGGRWAEAQALYEQALQWYPLHHGYRVQHAHMCKEQGNFVQAEIGYRDALALGAPGPDVEPHLAFVAERQGAAPGAPPATGVPASGPMGERPCAWDIHALGYILWRDHRLWDMDLLTLLRDCATGDAVAARMIEDDRFAVRNGPFLALMLSLP